MAIQIRSPLDGTIQTLCSIGATVFPSLSPALMRFDELRAASGGHPLYGTVNATDNAVPLFQVRSDLLELQCDIERSRLEAAALRYELIAAQKGLETSIAPQDLDRFIKKLDGEHGAFDGTSGHYIDGYSHDNSVKITSTLQQARELELEIFKQRQTFLLSEDYMVRLKVADLELNAAKKSLELINAQMGIGVVCAANKVRVTAVHAHQFQYVTKGDVVLEVEPVI